MAGKSSPTPPNSPAKGRRDERFGLVLSERYRLGELLGTGGMGSVYAAEHVLMRKKLAVKVLHSELGKVPEVVARFKREAMAAANIDHPNVAAATDFGTLPDGAVFLVLEYVQGRCLRDEIVQGPMPTGRALRVARQIASALSSAHALDIVHRDLKPENVMLVERGSDNDFVKVLDFGIAKVPVQEISERGSIRPGQPITKVGMVFGTPEYMAPEQALAQAVDGRADLYALGVMLFEMLAGVRPYWSESQVGILGQQLSTAIPKVGEKAPGVEVPAAVEALLEKLLDKEIEQRPASAREVVEAINALLPSVDRQAGTAARASSDSTSSRALPSSKLEAVRSAAARLPKVPVTARPLRPPTPSRPPPPPRRPSRPAELAPGQKGRSPLERHIPLPARSPQIRELDAPEERSALGGSRDAVSDSHRAALANEPGASASRSPSHAARQQSDGASHGQDVSPPPSAGAGARDELPSVGTPSSAAAPPAVLAAEGPASSARGARLGGTPTGGVTGSYRRAVSWVERWRARWPAPFEGSLRDVPSAALLWGALALGGIALVGTVVLAVGTPSGETRDAASTEREAKADTAASGDLAERAERGGSRASAEVPPAELEAAKVAGSSALLELSKRFPDAASIRLELAKSYRLEKRYAGVIVQLREAIKLEPQMRQDAEVATLLWQSTQKDDSRAAAFELLEGAMAARGADILFDLATTRGIQAQVKGRAEQYLSSESFDAVASPALKVAVELDRLKKCDDALALLPRVARRGDKRSLTYLRRMERQTGCGARGKRDCYPCLRGDRALSAAIDAVERRSRQ